MATLPDELDYSSDDDKDDPALLGDTIALPDELPQDVPGQDLPLVPSGQDLPVVPSGLQVECCKKGCLLLDSVKKAQINWMASSAPHSKTKEENRAMIFNQISERFNKQGTDRTYPYFGIPVCRPAFEKLWCCSGWLLNHYRDWCAKGETLPPQDLRQSRHKREHCPASECADCFWLWCYENLAENLAEGLSWLDDGGPSSTHIDVTFGHLDLGSSASSSHATCHRALRR